MVIGLTGGIACGKSTVAGFIERDLQIPVIDADNVSREIVAPGERCLQEIIERFGTDILASDGTLERKKLGAFIMNDEQARQDLMEITHPKIAERIMLKLMKLKNQGHSVAVVEAALMIENNSHKRYDKVIVVSCSPPTQRARLMKREGFTKEQADKWIDSQFPLTKKEQEADWVLRNDHDLANLKNQLLSTWKSFIEKVKDA